MKDDMLIKLAAEKFGCQVEELLAYAIREDCVVIIAPTGQKFTYTNDELEAIRARMMKAAPAKVAKAPEPEAQPSRPARKKATPEPGAEAEQAKAAKPPERGQTSLAREAAKGGRRRRDRPHKKAG